MDAVAGHDIGPTAENAGGGLLHVHQFEKAELSLFIVEEEVDVRLITRRRAEEIKVLHTEPLELRFMVPQSGYGLGAFH